MRILHACKSTSNGKFRDMPEKDAGGGRETGYLFGVALATCFNSCMQKRAGVAKGLGPGRDRDEANVILAQQCYSSL